MITLIVAVVLLCVCGYLAYKEHQYKQALHEVLSALYSAKPRNSSPIIRSLKKYLKQSPLHAFTLKQLEEFPLRNTKPAAPAVTQPKSSG